MLNNMLPEFWDFVAERQAIFNKRLQGSPPPWTTDPVLSQHRFTNIYRAADRVSQYLIRDVLYMGSQWPDEIFLRCTLFRLFNQPATYQRFMQRLGGVPTNDNFSFTGYSQIAADLLKENASNRSLPSVFNPAYILPPAQVHGFKTKHENLLYTLAMMLEQTAYNTVRTAGSLEGVYKVISTFPLMGPFLSFQLTIDLNYSTMLDFDENDFVVAGLGALRGLQKAFLLPSITTDKATRLLHVLLAMQEEELTKRNFIPLTLDNGTVRWPHLIDLQNCNCEFSKFTKVAYPELSAGIDKSAVPKIKQRYDPVNTTPLPTLWFPPKWRYESREANAL